MRNDQWSVSSAATRPWARLNRKLTSSFDKAVAADFNGNGKSDIAYGSSGDWTVSFDGRRPLHRFRHGSRTLPLRELLIGRFAAGIPRDQVVGFDGAALNFAIWRGLGSTNSFRRLSAQQMR